MSATIRNRVTFLFGVPTNGAKHGTGSVSSLVSAVAIIGLPHMAQEFAAAPSRRYLIFDKPTSSLDPELAGDVLNVMRDLAAEGMTMVVASHEIGFAAIVLDVQPGVRRNMLVGCSPYRFAGATVDRA
ncbi:hypothetical protein GGQ67_000705 [Rhizobium metallidurans]|uniref:Uncharacterized protein n=1 Tax=Rhizobium metallidurans TaxID=1265931 RepID=A0A7W6G9M2_9HYPH|nr:hypothetical protein [Rhizobium metallidurans]